VTPTPRIVHIDLGVVEGAPGQTVTLTATLESSGLLTRATANDLTYSGEFFDIDPSQCTINPGIRKTLVVGTLADGSAGSTTLRVFVQARENSEPIPDGVLYRCRVAIRSTTHPGSYLVRNQSVAAFGMGGEPHPLVVGRDGSIVVTLVAPCAGDCNRDGIVTIDEIITAVSVALGGSAASTCSPADGNSDGDVTIDEILIAVNRALVGC
jgi:hypothetical protein